MRRRSFAVNEIAHIARALDAERPFSPFARHQAILGIIYLHREAIGNDDAGSNSGSAYIFQRDGGIWSEVTKLTATDAAAGDGFGWSVAIQGDLAVIGVPFGDKGMLMNVGAVYVFDRNDPTPDAWGQVAKLTASDAAVGDWFGHSVSIDGPVIVVGVPLADEPTLDEGAAYIFRFQDPNWVEEAKLTALDASIFDNFGTSVSVAGDRAVVGAPNRDLDEPFDNKGGAYVFHFDTGSWTEEQILTACATDDDDLLGTSVSIYEKPANGGFVVVAGAVQNLGQVGPGRADVFGYLGAGWVRLHQLTASDADVRDTFGSSVSIKAGRVVVGALGWDADVNDFDEGAIYVFDGLDTAPSCDCPADLDGDCAVGVKDLLALIGAWGLCDMPCPPSCPADFDGDCDVNVPDLLVLLGDWGLCLCGEGTPPPPSLAQALADACVSQENWDKYVEKMTDPNASQEDKDRYDCWMRHYLFECNCFFCMAHDCPAPDPYTP